MYYIYLKPVPLLIIYIIILLVLYLIFRRKKRTITFFVLSVFSLYLLIIFNICILHLNIITDSILLQYVKKSKYIQPIPFATMRQTLNFGKQVMGNIILFAPMPIFIKIIKRNASACKVILYGIFSSLSIEIMQLLINIILGYQVHVCDVDDLILNSIGVVIGYLLFAIVRKIKFVDRLIEQIAYGEN